MRAFHGIAYAIVSGLVCWVLLIALGLWLPPATLRLTAKLVGAVLLFAGSYAVLGALVGMGPHPDRRKRKAYR
jgi:hypothetical protein